ncbi:MAG: hypothetical protein OXU21_03260 [Chloroflexota bacterium]|nr:hypothetical protein [Chloroflexota bacterium]
MTARNFGRRLPVALLTALCAIVLTGCIRVEMSFTVDEDGSGAVEMVVAVDESLLTAADESPDDMLGDVDDLPPGAVVDAYREDGFVGQRITVPVADMELAAESLGGADDMTDAVDFGFVREGDGWRFTMDAPPLGEELAGENGDFTAGMTAAIVNTAEFRVRVSLPGEITEHNADRIENGVLVWELDFLDTEPRTLSARSQAAGVGPVVVVVAGGAAAALAVLAALAARSAVRARRRA